MNSQHAAVHRFTHHCIPGAQNSVWHLVDSHQTFAEGMTETDVVSAIMESTVQVEKQLNMQRGYRQEGTQSWSQLRHQFAIRPGTT